MASAGQELCEDRDTFVTQHRAASELSAWRGGEAGGELRPGHKGIEDSLNTI